MVKENDKEWCKVCRQRNDLLSRREEILWQREDIMQAREKQLREDELIFEEKKRVFCLAKLMDSEERGSIHSIESCSTVQDSHEGRITNVSPSGEPTLLESKEEEMHHVETGGNLCKKDLLIQQERKIEAQKRLLEEKEKSLLVQEEKMKAFESLIEMKLNALLAKQKDIQDKLSLITRKEMALNEANEMIILKEIALRDHEKILNIKESNILNKIFLFSSDSCPDIGGNLGMNQCIVKQPDDQINIFQAAVTESGRYQNQSSLKDTMNWNQNQALLEESIKCYEAQVLKSQQRILDDVMTRVSGVEEMEKETNSESFQENDPNKIDIDPEPVSEKEKFLQLLSRAGRDCTLGAVPASQDSMKNVKDDERSCSSKAVDENDSNLDDIFFSHFEQSKEALRQNMLLEGKNSVPVSADEGYGMTEHILNDSRFREQLQAFSQDLLYNIERNGERNVEMITPSKNTDLIPLLKDSVDRQEMSSTGDKTLCKILKIPEFLKTENEDLETDIVPQSCSNRIISETNSISSSENLYVPLDDSTTDLSKKSSQESLIKSKEDIKNVNFEDSSNRFFGKKLFKYSEDGNMEEIPLLKYSADTIKFNKQEKMDKSGEIDTPAGSYNPGNLKSKRGESRKMIDSMKCNKNGVSNLQLQVQDDKYTSQESILGCQTKKTEVVGTSQEIDVNVSKSVDFHTKTTPIFGSSDSVCSRRSSVVSTTSSSSSIHGSSEKSKKLRKRPPRDALLKAIASNQYLEIVKLVESKNLMLEQLDGSGRSAFLLGVSKGNVDLVQRLKSRGANIWACDYDGNSGLHIAVANNDYGMLEVLLKIGLNPNVTNNQGKTAMQLASDLKRFHLLETMERSFHFQVPFG